MVLRLLKEFSLLRKPQNALMALIYGLRTDSIPVDVMGICYF